MRLSYLSPSASILCHLPASFSVVLAEFACCPSALLCLLPPPFRRHPAQAAALDASSCSSSLDLRAVLHMCALIVASAAVRSGSPVSRLTVGPCSRVPSPWSALAPPCRRHLRPSCPWRSLDVRHIGRTGRLRRPTVVGLPPFGSVVGRCNGKGQKREAGRQDLSSRTVLGQQMGRQQICQQQCWQNAPPQRQSVSRDQKSVSRD